MKNSFLIAALGLFISINVWSQSEVVSKTVQDTIDTKAAELHPNLDFTFGYAPRSPFHAFKTSFSANNVYFKRCGLYFSLEKGLDSDYFAGTIGITTTIHKYVYLWGGVGVFPKNSSGNRNEWSYYRKEFGVGITPLKMTVIRLGWSLTVGPTAAVGFKIPIKPIFKRKNETGE